MKNKINQQSIAIIIYVRLNSKRLPEKAFLKINSKSILEILIDRIKNFSKYNLSIIVATSREKTDDKLLDFCKKKKIKIFRGSLNDIHKRTTDCIKYNNLDGFIRVCADRPFFDVLLMDKMIKKFLESNYDIITNQFIKTYPKGLACEIAKSEIFLKKKSKKLSSSEKEHIFNYYYKNHKNYKIFNFKLKKNKNFKFKYYSINTRNDFEKIKKIYKTYKNKKYIDILKTL